MTRERHTDEECAIEECGGTYVKDEGDHALREKWCAQCWFIPTDSYFRNEGMDPWEEFVAWRESEDYPYDRKKTHGSFPQAYFE